MFAELDATAESRGRVTLWDNDSIRFVFPVTVYATTRIPEDDGYDLVSSNAVSHSASAQWDYALKDGDDFSRITFTVRRFADRTIPNEEKVTFVGIYKLTHDRLTICFAPDDEPLPDTLEPGVHRIFVEFKRGEGELPVANDAQITQKDRTELGLTRFLPFGVRPPVIKMRQHHLVVIDRSMRAESMADGRAGWPLAVDFVNRTIQEAGEDERVTVVVVGSSTTVGTFAAGENDEVKQWLQSAPSPATSTRANDVLLQAVEAIRSNPASLQKRHEYHGDLLIVSDLADSRWDRGALLQTGLDLLKEGLGTPATVINVGKSGPKRIELPVWNQ